MNSLGGGAGGGQSCFVYCIPQSIMLLSISVVNKFVFIKLRASELETPFVHLIFSNFNFRSVKFRQIAMDGGLTYKQKYGFLSVVAVVMSLTGLPASSLAFWSLLLLIWLFLGGHRTLYLAYHTLGRDLR